MGGARDLSAPTDGGWGMTVAGQRRYVAAVPWSDHLRAAPLADLRVVRLLWDGDSSALAVMGPGVLADCAANRNHSDLHGAVPSLPEGWDWPEYLDNWLYSMHAPRLLVLPDVPAGEVWLYAEDNRPVPGAASVADLPQPPDAIMIVGAPVGADRRGWRKLGALLAFLVGCLVLAVCLYVAHLIIGMLALPPQIGQLALIIIGLIGLVALIWLVWGAVGGAAVRVP